VKGMTVLKKNRKLFVGTVTSDRMEKTVVVTVPVRYMDPRFKKYIKRKRKYMVHDPDKRCRIGDLIQIEECRPLSRHKRWFIKDVIRKAE
jgi:small subunit ribosomal protein S17